jgi:hypothetical protein
LSMIAFMNTKLFTQGHPGAKRAASASHRLAKID